MNHSIITNDQGDDFLMRNGKHTICPFRGRAVLNGTTVQRIQLGDRQVELIQYTDEPVCYSGCNAFEKKEDGVTCHLIRRTFPTGENNSQPKIVKLAIEGD